MNSSSNTYYTVTPVNLQEVGWQPDATINNKIHVDSGITSNWKYRQYIQNNAKHIMKYNTMEACYTLGLNPATVVNTETLPNSPFVFKSTTDNDGPAFGYSRSDLKNLYLTSEQLNARMISPSIPM